MLILIPRRERIRSRQPSPKPMITGHKNLKEHFSRADNEFTVWKDLLAN
jgi:hypothetical protein